jgi:tetratricopeptide (TPR) repeat protein
MRLPLLLCCLLAASGAAYADPPKPPPLPTVGQSADAVRLGTCLAKIDANEAEAAYEQAMAWARETNVREARQCAGMALVAMGRPAAGAEKLQALGEATDGGDATQKLETLSQAGNAWILANDPAHARAALSEALRLAPKDPDLLIDRARAYAMTGAWREAEEDLSAALDVRKQDTLALTLRAQARLRLGVLDLAQKDADDALRLSPKNVDALLVRGGVLEARRTGKIPD